jgi:meso-butanediol dehydrogenase / (S,S)-butanediol dehydrogenase / diacetyl reductase
VAPTVLITGGGSGIGAAVARRMARDGWAVCVSGRREGPLAAVADEVGGAWVAADSATEAGAQAAVDAAIGRFGRLDALVTSAGAAAGGTAEEQTLERWERVVATNLTGVFLTCRAALPHLLDGGGAIVTVASLAGLRAGPASVAYASSKAGAIMLTQCIALDHGPAGVRANCVCPGWIRTDMADAAMDDLAALRGCAGRDEAYALATGPVPARRPGTAEEAAAAVAWLAGPEASYLNGAVIPVDGGSAVVDCATLAFRPTTAASG